MTKREISDPAPMPVGLEARPYQRRIVERTLQLFSGMPDDHGGEDGRPVTSVLIESPTGSGKTVMALAVARWMQRRHGMTVGWAAMRRNLLVRAAAQNATWGFGVDLRLI